MEDNPKVTVIIPVKDRKEYLFHTLRSCMAQDYRNFEVIVADDASTDGTQEMVRNLSLADNRITLIDRPVRLGMRDNFEDALSRIKEGYVMAIGGDDGIMPHGISRMVSKFKETGVKLLTWNPPLFEYPSSIRKNGRFSVSRVKGDYMVKSAAYLARQPQLLNYLDDKECPMFYVKGAAHISLVKKVKSRTKDGRFYSCPTPDGYSGIVLAGEVEEFYFSQEPYTLYGISPSSQGLAYTLKDKKAKENSMEFFKFSETQSMHRELASQPYSPLLALMTVDYLMTAKDLPGWGGTFPDIDYKEVLRKSLLEMSHSYDDSRMQREIYILDAIAKQHGLQNYYHELLRTMKKYSPCPVEYKTAISRERIYIDSQMLGLCDICDASYAAENFIRLKPYLDLKFYWHAVIRSLKVRFSKKIVRGDFSSELRILKSQFNDKSSSD
jgi:glycosyltransferase involved in cell wall biosynthesis